MYTENDNLLIWGGTSAEFVELNSFFTKMGFISTNTEILLFMLKNTQLELQSAFSLSYYRQNPLDKLC